MSGRGRRTTLARRRELLVMRAELQRLTVRHDLAALQAHGSPWAGLARGAAGIAAVVRERPVRTRTMPLLQLALAAWQCWQGWRAIRESGRARRR
ncbi:MAG TPA: hypothetical protein VFY73_26030 [Ideonella sp.]|uniref:hypothetical protein n=1 Tax=Ideonella sp. TaxID=1929293 RepID=UPI002E2EFB30|nr:hypothetical protein [Ideonella sp.]HEX5687489.1 hypothetical protein [Ideonella sp.]